MLSPYPTPKKGDLISQAKLSIRINEKGTSLVVQWLKLCQPMQGAQVSSPGGKLGPHMPQGRKRKKHQTEAIVNKDLKNSSHKKKERN